MRDSSDVHYRALTVADVGAVLRIQAQCYGAGYVESAEVFTRRLRAAHHCSWGVQSSDGVVAYLAAYWSLPGKVTPLQGDFAVQEDASVLYLHDMAVQPDYVGRGIAKQLLGHAIALAEQRGMQRAALVAVQGAHGYWARQGFRVSEPLDTVQESHLHSYGADARYMERVLSGSSALSRSLPSVTSTVRV